MFDSQKGVEGVDSERAQLRELIRNSAQSTLDALRQAGGIEYVDMSRLYNDIAGSGVTNLIVRREDPTKVLGAFAEGSFTITFPDGERYSNAALWDPRAGAPGLDNAYLEGYGHLNHVVVVVGFLPNDDMDIVQLPDAQRQFAGIDRTRVRSVCGVVSDRDIVFVSVRIPAFAYPYDQMTQSERERYDDFLDTRTDGVQPTPMFIHRGFRFVRSRDTDAKQ